MERDLESAQAKIKYLEFDQKSNREDEKYKIKYEKLKVKNADFMTEFFFVTKWTSK